MAWVCFVSPALGVACSGAGEAVDAPEDPGLAPSDRSGPLTVVSRAVPSRAAVFPALADGDRAPEEAVALECEDTCSSTRAECGVVCDENCGECGRDETCENGQCVCQSSCDGTRCSDGCGRPCACPFGAVCDGAGFCVPAEGCGEASCAPGGAAPEAPEPPSPVPVPPIPEL